jgi:trigger factor
MSMQTNLESLSSLERRMSVILPVDQVNSEVETRLKSLARTAKVHGFRPGKVPIKIVAQNYGGQVRQEVLGDAVQRSFGEVVKEKNLRVAGYPRFEVKSGLQGDDQVEYVATFEVYPEIKLGQLSDAKVERLAVAVGDAEVNKTVEILRKQRVNYQATERAAAESDQVLMDYAGSIEGVPFEGGSGENQAAILGEGRLLPEFEKNLIGLKSGAETAFEITFPSDYPAPTAGKKARFEVKLKEVRAAVLPEVDADFARQLGVPDGDIAKMREDVKANLEKEVKRRVQARLKDQVMKTLQETSTVEVPKSLLELEIERMQQQMRRNLEGRGMPADKMPMPREAFEPEAQRRVTLGLLLSEVVRVNKLEAKAEQIKAVIVENAQGYEKPEEVVRWYYQSPERMREVESVVLEECVVNWVLGQVKVEDKAGDFDELMGAAK